MIATTVVLLVAALIGGIWTMRKARKSTFLRHTRQELANDPRRVCWATNATRHEPPGRIVDDQCA